MTAEDEIATLRRRVRRADQWHRLSTLPSVLLVAPGMMLAFGSAMDHLGALRGMAWVTGLEVAPGAESLLRGDGPPVTIGAIAVAGLWCGVQGLLWRRTLLLRAELKKRERAAPPEERSFALLLRSFFIDRSLTTQSRGGFVGQDLSVGHTETLHDRLERALLGRLAVEWIGDRRWFAISGRAVEEHDAAWKPAFERFAEHAKVIVMTPVLVGEGGTLEEIEHLAARPELMAKTLFVAPSDQHVLLDQARGAGLAPKIRTLWANTRARVAERAGFDLPPYPGVSALFVPSSRGHRVVHGVAGRSWDHPKSLRSLLIDGRLREPLWREALGYGLQFTLSYVILAATVALITAMVLTNLNAPPILWAAVIAVGVFGYLRTWREFCGRYATRRRWGRLALMLGLIPAATLGTVALEIGWRYAAPFAQWDDERSVLGGLFPVTMVFAVALAAYLPAGVATGAAILALVRAPKHWRAPGAEGGSSRDQARPKPPAL